MYYGDIVENGDTSKIFKNPLHPYTKLLVEVSPTKNKKIQSDDFGELPNMIKPQMVVYFMPCRKRNEICYKKSPTQINKGEDLLRATSHFKEENKKKNQVG